MPPLSSKLGILFSLYNVWFTKFVQAKWPPNQIWQNLINFLVFQLEQNGPLAHLSLSLLEDLQNGPSDHSSLLCVNANCKMAPRPRMANWSTKDQKSAT